MEKETNQENSSFILTTTATTINDNLSPRKTFGGGGGGDRLKRDEWSEGAVSSLLEAYENKWVLRNRAKLKGHDWEDVARHVSSRANSTKSTKTQTQCKNKIESMKKRYRSESAAAADSSSWPLYSRLDLLLRGNAIAAPAKTETAPAQAQQVPSVHQNCGNPPLIVLEPSPVVPQPQMPPEIPPERVTAQNSNGSDGVERVAKEDGIGTINKLSDHQASDRNAMETDSSSTPAMIHSDNGKSRPKNKKLMMKLKTMEKKKKMRRSRREDQWEIADSIRWLAEAMVRSEQAKMETMRELEKMRIEAEAKRGEMDLKRTEIIANTQLEIAKIFAAGHVGKGVDSSLRIGRN